VRFSPYGLVRSKKKGKGKLRVAKTSVSDKKKKRKGGKIGKYVRDEDVLRFVNGTLVVKRCENEA